MYGITVGQVISEARKRKPLTKELLYIFVDKIQKADTTLTVKQSYDCLAEGLGYLEWSVLWNELTAEGFIRYRQLN